MTAATSQPAASAATVSVTSLTSGLTALLNPPDGFKNLVGGGALVNAGVTVSGAVGARAFDTTGTRAATTRIELPFAASGAVSVFAIVSRDIDTDSIGGAIDGVQELVTNRDGTFTTPFWELNLGNGYGAAIDKLKCRFSNNAAGIGTIYVNGVAETGNNPGSTALVSGTFYNIAATEASAATASGSSNTTLFATGTTQDFNGRVQLFALWNRTLSAAEVTALQTNPWQLFDIPGSPSYPMRSEMYF